MSRFLFLLAVLVFLFSGISLAIPGTSSVSEEVPDAEPAVTTAPTASSTLVVALPAEAPATTTLPAKKPTSPTPTPPKKEPATQPVVTEQPPTPAVPSVPAITNASLDAAAASARAALVNIICYAPPGSSIRSISGSGIIIDPKGIILTNAHVAQHFLYGSFNVSCTIRSGSPAADKYQGALVHLSPSWVNANKNILSVEEAVGTGEYDFALVAITKSATSAPLPAAFPYVPLGKNPPEIGAPVVLASYGAQFIASSQIQSSLFPTVVFGSVKDLFTFKANTPDVIALGGSVAAQEGSSGGGAIDASGTLVGTITTSTISGSTDTRSLDAITASYVRAQYAAETGNSLESVLAQPTAVSIADFAPSIPGLRSILTANL